MNSVRKKLVFFLFVAIVIYGVWNGRNLIRGPQIEIISPQDGATVTSQTLEVDGKARNVAFISLNGRQIFTDTDGLFSEEILPHDGYNILEIAAEDRFGKKVNKKIRFYYNNE